MVKKQVHPACSHCGSASVKADAFATWDFKGQRWEVEDAFDKNGFCEICDNECSIVWRDGKPLHYDPRIVVGAIVEWTDPDEGKCNGEYSVQSIVPDDGENDVLRLVNNLHGEVEAFRYEVTFVEDGGTCDECGERCADIMGCPDGREVCRDCFDNGVG